MFLKHFVIALNVSAFSYNGLDTHYDTKLTIRRVPKRGNYRTDTAFIGQMQYAFKRESKSARCI